MIKKHLLALTLSCVISPCFAQSADEDVELLKLVSCVLPKDNPTGKPAISPKLESASDRFGTILNESWKTPYPGPLLLAGACIKDVQVFAAFGSFAAKGEVCNADSEAFLAALSATGLILKRSGSDQPSRILASAHGGDDFTYTLAKGKFSFEGKVEIQPGNTVSFLCAIKSGGHQ